MIWGFIAVWLVVLTAFLLWTSRLTHLDTGQSGTSFSLIVPFRNEAVNLPRLIESLNNIDYPGKLYEVIFIDDFSDDKSKEIILNTPKNFDWKILQSTGYQFVSPKKAALETGIASARYPWILTIDADSRIPGKILRVYHRYLTLHPGTRMILGPVKWNVNRKLPGKIQAFEMSVIQMLTAAASAVTDPFLANGTNLLFRKDVFREVGGYEGYEKFAGGDDVFLVRKFHRLYPGKIRYLADRQAVVTTEAAGTWGELLNQRLRWAKKTPAVNQGLSLVFSLSLLIFAFWPVITLLLILLKQSLIHIFIVALISLLSEIIIMIYLNRFFGYKLKPPDYIVLPVIYPFYLLAFGWFVITHRGNFTWKGRRYSR